MSGDHEVECVMTRPRHLRTRAAQLAVILAATGVLSAVTAGPAHAADGLSCRYTPSGWSGGFSADLTIFNNTANTINGWTAVWNFRDPTQVTVTWNGTITQSTPFDATARNMAFNAQLRPGASAALGWVATAVATDIPAQILVNGTLCPLI